MKNKDEIWTWRTLSECKKYFNKKLFHYELKNKKHKKVLNYIEHSLILISTVTGCVSIFDFASLVGIPMGITSTAVELKICVITAGIKKYESIIKKKEKEAW